MQDNPSRACAVRSTPTLPVEPPHPRPTTDDLGPPHAWPWLGEDRHLARRAFAYDVALAHRDPDDKLAHCDLYAARWGHDELAAALRYADRLAPLGPGMSTLLRDLTARAVR